MRWPWQKDEDEPAPGTTMAEAVANFAALKVKDNVDSAKVARSI